MSEKGRAEALARWAEARDFAEFITEYLPERVSGQELTGVH